METDEFLAYLSNVKRYSQHTITAYAEDLCQFIEFCEKVENVSEWTEVTPLVVRHFEMELMAGRLNRRKRQGRGRPKALNARSVQRKLCALRSLFRYLIHEGVVEHSPMEGVAPLKFAKKLPVFVPDYRMDTLLDKKISINTYKQSSTVTGEYNGLLSVGGNQNILTTTAGRTSGFCQFKQCIWNES